MNISLTDLIIYSIGFTAQILFFSRSFIQWIKTEKAKRIISPVIFWQISLVASIIMMLYGILRSDPAIIIGQLITFYIYIRNLQISKTWKKIPAYFRYPIPFIPPVFILILTLSPDFNSLNLFSEQNISPLLMIFGIIAQIIFTFRFVYQWIIAEKNKASILIPGFWFISLIGASLTIIYAIMRIDPVLFLSNLGGLIMYTRNLIINHKGNNSSNLIQFN
jgi:lipid-A-disaccharide synthase-like uncharacterized protein